MVEIKKRLDPDDHYDNTNNPKYIVVHDTGNETDSDEGNANYFVTGKRNASAHYFVDDDSITQVVEDYDGAYHCGDGRGKYGIHNNNSIGIEMCRQDNKVTDKTLKNTIDLIKMLMSKYDIPINRVVRHYDTSRKNCPSSLNYNNWEGWNNFMNILKKDQNLTWQEIISKVSSSPTDWENAINTASAAAKADGNLGSLEIMKYLPELIKKIWNC